MIELHPETAKVKAMLSREEAYPDHFTSADRIAERLTRFRTGLVHVLTDVLPNGDKESVSCWLSQMLLLIDMANLDAEKDKAAKGNHIATTTPQPSQGVEHDVKISCKYSGQLLDLWDAHLDEKLQAANPTAAARFRTLISELNDTVNRADFRLDKAKGRTQ